MPQNSEASVFTPRLLRALSSGVVVSSATKIRVLMRFKSDEDMNRFLEQQDEIAGGAGSNGNQRFTVVRVLRSTRMVALEVRLDVLNTFADSSEDLGVDQIDEDFLVFSQLADVHVLHEVAFARDNDWRGRGVLVAVLDTGVDGEHPDLADALVKHLDMTGEGTGDRNGHGTHVASIIAGRGIANPSRVGVADQASIIDVKVLDEAGSGRASGIIEGIEKAIEEDVWLINMSLGAPGEFDGTDPLSQAANWAVGQGVTVVCAAGNCGPAGNPLQCPVRGDKTIGAPGAAERVLTVGAVDKTLSLAGYSSRGPTYGGLTKPDVVAVGTVTGARAAGTAMGTPVNNQYTTASGTSMATPVVTGLVAALLQKLIDEGGDTSPESVKNRILEVAQELPGLDQNEQGAGFLSAKALFSAVEETKLEVVSFEPILGLQPVLTGQRWGLSVRNSGESELYDVSATLEAAGDGISIDPATKSLGNLHSLETETVYFLVKGTASGSHTVRIRLTFRSSVDGPSKSQLVVRQVSLSSTTVTGSQLDDVLSHAVNRFLELQNSDGTWAGSIMYNAWTPGMYCILRRIMGLAEPKETLDWLEHNRLGIDERGDSDDTWGFIDVESLHMLESTVAGEIALEVWGRGRNEKTWAYLNNQTLQRLQPALALVDPFTQTFSALANDYRPADTPIYYGLSAILAPPIEAILSPPLLKLSLSRFVATWAQDASVGLMITLAVANGKATNPAKLIMLKVAESRLLRNQRSDGSWYCTVLPTLSATMALYQLGYRPDDEVMANALDFLETLRRPDGYVERFHLPVWDTGLSVLGLRAAGLPVDHPSLRRAGQYLMDAQDPVSGGVPFQKENSIWPDTDDTSVVCLALNELDMGPSEARKKFVIHRGLRWMRFLQGHDGGFASFQKDQSSKVRGRLPYFLNDPPTADVTGHVLSSMKLLKDYGFDNTPVDDGLEWLRSFQLSDGTWHGRWGLTYTYGTAAVMQALSDLGESRNQPFTLAAVDRLLQMQNADGGWGENFITYYNIAAPSDAESTVEQTAWTVIALLMAPQTPRVLEATDRGVAFILGQYSFSDGWPTDKYTVGALWVYRNSIYAYAWSLWALGLYRQMRGAE